MSADNNNSKEEQKQQQNPIQARLIKRNYSKKHQQISHQNTCKLLAGDKNNEDVSIKEPTYGGKMNKESQQKKYEMLKEKNSKK